jgi:hypothetical protein
MAVSKLGLLASAVLLAGTACQSAKPVRKEKIFGVPIVMPTAMCPELGTVAVSLGEEGERMVCEMQVPLGTHLPRCVCRDEGMMAQQKEDTDPLLRQLEVGIQTGCRPGEAQCNNTGNASPNFRPTSKAQAQPRS